jgi:hypothetical protein
MTLMKPSDTEFYAIGRMVVYVGYIEQSVSETYKRICEVRSHTCESKLMISKKLKFIEKSVSHDEEDFLCLIKKTKNLFRLRNSFIHDQYYGQSMSKSLSLYSGSLNKSRKISIKDIDEISRTALGYRSAWKRMTITGIRLKEQDSFLKRISFLVKKFMFKK